MTPAPRLIVFSDLELAPEAVLLERVEWTARAALPGTVLFILRDKERSARERLRLGEGIRERARGHGQRFGVAERLDLALLLGADAVHLGESSVDAADARRLLPAGTFVSRACHDPEQCAELDADALLLSPLLGPRKGRPALGLEALARARRLCSGRRLYALGGIDAENAAACLAAGADGVAVIGAGLRDEPEPLLRALASAQPAAARENHS